VLILFHAIYSSFYTKPAWCIVVFDVRCFCLRRLTRGNQLFVFPIHLSEYVSLSPIFYGTFVPLAAYFAIKLLIVKPYVDKQQERYTSM